MLTLRLTRAAFMRSALLLVVALVAFPGGPPSRAASAGDQAWPPLPPVETMRALNEGEARAGVVVLETATEVSAGMKRGALGMKGTVTRSTRYRILVLDARGAENVRHQSLFGEHSPKASEIKGRTVAPDGREYPLEPDKDIHILDPKNIKGESRAPVRSAFFPHVEPGSVLDLAFTVTSDDLPDYEEVALQLDLPVRRSEVVVHGLILDNSASKAFWLGLKKVKVHWVPFFLGATPPRAHATLNAEFDLRLTVSDLPASEDAPYAPPDMRTRYTLGLLPRFISLEEDVSIEDRRRNLLLFGPPPSEAPAENLALDRDLDASHGMIRLDDLGLQTIPEWQSDHGLMKWHQDMLRRDQDRLEKFYRKAGDGESEQEVATIAPLDLDWRTRARRLYEHVRSRVRPDPDAEQQKSLAKLIEYGRGTWADMALYLTYLFEKAHIPARIVVPMNRFRLPFQPIVETFRTFGAVYVVEVAPPGEGPIYLTPGDIFGNFGSFPDSYLGALAFLQPKGVDEDWSLGQIPLTLPIRERTEVAFSAPFDPQGGETTLTLTSTLHDSASTDFRWWLGREGPKTDKVALNARREKAIAGWVDRWANLEFRGNMPNLDPAKDTDKPFAFELTTPWTPDVQHIGEQVLIPALPHARLFTNRFETEHRSDPIWLTGGRFEVSMTWVVPAGASVEQIPAPAEVKGPGGLAFKMDVAFRPAEEGRPTGELTSRVSMDQPYMLPAPVYPGVKKFFEDVQRLADTRLLLATGPTR